MEVLYFPHTRHTIFFTSPAHSLSSSKVSFRWRLRQFGFSLDRIGFVVEMRRMAYAFPYGSSSSKLYIVWENDHPFGTRTFLLVVFFLACRSSTRGPSIKQSANCESSSSIGHRDILVHQRLFNHMALRFWDHCC